jgi:pilus assembly protein CpaE
MIRVLVATPDPDLVARLRALLSEAGDVEVVDTADRAAEVTRLLSDDDTPLDVVVLHDELGPLPVLDLARDLNHRFPQVGVVLLSRETSVEQLRSAMSAGIRSVVRIPLTLTEVHGAIVEANEWAQTVQTRLAAVGDGQRRVSRGRVVALTGAKGGVGTTVLAVQLALAFKRRDPDSSVCLVDLDLQTGDVRGYLDIAHRRSVTDLIEVASELTTGHLTDAMYSHPSGVRVLLPPPNGEDAEDLDGTTTARILGGIRARFDTVVIDAGSVSTEASVTAVELADEVLLVCAPDVVSLRGANRALGLWERLGVRDGGVRAVLNRASRDREIQPSLAARVLHTPVARTVIPDRTQDVEAAANTGDPARLAGAVREAVEDLAGEVADGAPAPEADDDGQRDDTLAARVAGQSGALSVEFTALLLPLGVTLLLIWQLVLTGYTTLLANHAATEGARVLALEGEDQARIEAAARAAMHGHWERHLEVAPVTGDEVHVRIPVPILVPGTSTPWRVTTSAGAVREEEASRAPEATEVVT